MTNLAARVLAALAVLTALAPLMLPILLAPGVELPDRLMPVGGERLALLVLGTALAFATTSEYAIGRALAGVTAAVALIVAASWVFPAASGELAALRPSALTALGLAALGASIWLRQPERADRAAAAWVGVAAAAILFLVFTGHLFGAEVLTTQARAAPAASTQAGALLLLMLAIGALGTHAGAPVSAYLGDDPGAVARRRMLPAAVLTPVASGLLLLYALDSGELSAALAVTLTVFANVSVMLLLVNGAGNKVARVAQQHQERLQAREAAARRQGQRDKLTGLLNRGGWDAAMQTAERRCKADQINAGIVIIDLDGLKRINDTQGHAAGDELIQNTAAALRKAARRGDALARLGGDEFACLVIGCVPATARAVVERCEDALHAAGVSASVGYAMRNEGSLVEAFKEADAAMYAQKRARKLRRA